MFWLGCVGTRVQEAKTMNSCIMTVEIFDAFLKCESKTYFNLQDKWKKLTSYELAT